MHSRITIPFALALLIVCLGASAFAFSDDSATASVQTASSSPNRNYPGGKDEQDLTVQATLPQPVRSLDKQFKVGADVEEEPDADEGPQRD